MIFITVSFSVLFLHFYRYCPILFHLLPREGLVGRLLTNFANYKLFDSAFTSKLVALGLLVVYIIMDLPKSSATPSWAKAVYHLMIALLLYFISIIFVVSGLNYDYPVIDGSYIIASVAGYFIAMSGCTRLFLYFKSIWNTRDVFNKEGTSFPQEEGLINTKFSINLKARYWWDGSSRKSWINFVNPRRGLLIMGSPGSGKSWFIIENAIRQLMEKGFALFVYDFKNADLTLLAYNCFLEFRHLYPEGTKFYSINFDDLSKSNRCNCIDPYTLHSIEDAVEVSRSMLLGGNKSWTGKQGDFWVESPMSFVAAVIWFLRKYEGGRYCTLPHVIELVHTPYEQLFAVLSTEPDIEVIINPFKQALESGDMELLNGLVTSAKIPLGRLASPDLYYILSESDFQPDINNRNAPKIFCLGGSAARQEALAPVLSLFIDRTCKLVNKPGNHRSALICDEFSTVRATSIMTVIATGRTNEIVPIIAFQDFSQLKMHYSQSEAEALLNLPGNIICGQVHGETGKMVSDRFLSVMQKQVSRSTNSRDTSVSESEHSGRAISPATLSNLSSGEFVGIVADEPATPIDLKGFHAKVINDEKAIRKERAGWKALPWLRVVNQTTVEKNFDRIRQEVKDLVKKVISRKSGDPEF